MKLVVRTRQVELTPELREVVNRRIAFSFARVAFAVGQVDVTLGDVNGPRGGIDKVCRIRVRSPGMADIVIEEADADLRAAIDGASARAGRTVQRAIARRRTVTLGEAT